MKNPIAIRILLSNIFISGLIKIIIKTQDIIRGASAYPLKIAVYPIKFCKNWGTRTTVENIIILIDGLKIVPIRKFLSLNSLKFIKGALDSSSLIIKNTREHTEKPESQQIHPQSNQLYC